MHSGVFYLFIYLFIFQSKQISDMKVLLRDAAEREQELVHEKDELQQKVCYFFVTFAHYEFMILYLKGQNCLPPQCWSTVIKCVFICNMPSFFI